MVMYKWFGHYQVFLVNQSTMYDCGPRVTYHTKLNLGEATLYCALLR